MLTSSRFANEDRSTHPTFAVAGPSRDAFSRDRSAFSRQLAVVPEMLATLDTLTTAGQHHVMGKVLAFIGDQVGRVSRGLNLRNQRMFLDLLGHLTTESRRLLPDIRSFNRRTESLVALLAAIA